MIERRVRDRKVADPWFDSRNGNASYLWETHVSLGNARYAYFPLGQAVYSLW